jgi:hypothetical protein
MGAINVIGRGRGKEQEIATYDHDRGIPSEGAGEQLPLVDE